MLYRERFDIDYKMVNFKFWGRERGGEKFEFFCKRVVFVIIYFFGNRS